MGGWARWIRFGVAPEDLQRLEGTEPVAEIRQTAGVGALVRQADSLLKKAESSSKN